MVGKFWSGFLSWLLWWLVIPAPRTVFRDSQSEMAFLPVQLLSFWMGRCKGQLRGLLSLMAGLWISTSRYVGTLTLSVRSPVLRTCLHCKQNRRTLLCCSDPRSCASAGSTCQCFARVFLRNGVGTENIGLVGRKARTGSFMLL